MLRHIAVLSIIVTAMVLSAILVWNTSIPLGVPGEWTWQRIPSSQPIESRLLFPVIALLGYLVVAWGGSLWIESTPTKRSFALGLLFVASLAWLVAVEDAAPPGYGWEKAPFVLYFPGSSGYFTAAREDTSSIRDFLSGYEAQMAKGDVLHIGTHPPGLTVAFKAFLTVFRARPELAPILMKTEPSAASDAFNVIAELTARDALPLRAPDRAALWFAALIVLFSAAITIVPLYSLMSRSFGRKAAWWSAALWPLVTAVPIFMPKSDVLLACCSVLFLWVVREAVETKSARFSALTGFLAWLFLQISLAILPVLLLAGLRSAWRVVWPPPPKKRRNVHLRSRRELPYKMPIAAGLGFLLPIAAVYGWSGMNCFNVWWMNFNNHAGFYAQYPRSYFPWLGVNLIELMIAAGPPLVTIAVLGGWYLCWQNRDAARWPMTVLLVWGLLWISGKNMGEVARLWILLMPWLVAVSAGFWPQHDPAVESHSYSRRRISDSLLPMVILLLQGVHTLVIMSRVVGFHFPGT